MGDAAFMDRALFLAERGLGRTSPNPIVGAVVVSPDGVVVGQGAHLDLGGPHAEVNALEMAGSRAAGATMFVTLEPCCHVGRTGPCAAKIVEAGVARVSYAVADPNPRVSGGGAAYLREHGVEVIQGLRRAEAERQHRPFFTWIREKRPAVTVKMAVSSDGFVGKRGGRVMLTGPSANRWTHRQRAAVDALAVGSETILVDDSLLTPRGAYRSRPLTRVIFDWRLRVEASAAVFSTLDVGPVIMVTSAEAVSQHPSRAASLRQAGAEVHGFGARSLRAVLEWLASRGIADLLVEGGPTLAGALIAEGLVDRMQWIVTPARLGDGVRWSLGGVDEALMERPPIALPLGADALLEFDVHRTH